MINASTLTPLPPYFIVKIGKLAQKEKEEKEGRFYFPPEYAFMQRKMQFGEIVAIGEGAAAYMRTAEIGDYLLIHHLIEGKKAENGYSYYFITEDNDFNYYAVNAYEIPGEMSLSYAVAKGEEIIPTPDYILLEVPVIETDGNLMEKEVSQNGLVVAKEKKLTREQKIVKSKQNMERIKQLSRNLVFSDADKRRMMREPDGLEKIRYAEQECKRLQAENERLSKEINKRTYDPFVVAAINPEFNDHIKACFGREIIPGEKIYMLNIACKTVVDFGGVPYIVANTKYVGCPEYWLKSGHDEFKHSHATTATASY